MLKLTKAQEGHFSQEALLAFEERMLALCRIHWKRAYIEKGEEYFRNLIHTEIPFAFGYGLRSERDVGQYLNAVIALRVSFNMDPRAEWVRAIMTEPGATPTAKLYTLSVKIAKLYKETKK